MYPVDLGIEAGKMIANKLNCQIIVTGSPGEKNLAQTISNRIGDDAFSLAGLLNLDEFIALIDGALIVSVNTATRILQPHARLRKSSAVFP